MYIKKYFYCFHHLKQIPKLQKIILIIFFQKTLLNTYIPKIKKLMHDSENYLAFDHSIFKNQYNKFIMGYCNYYFYSFYKLFKKFDCPLHHTFNTCDFLIM